MYVRAPAYTTCTCVHQARGREQGERNEKWRAQLSGFCGRIIHTHTHTHTHTQSVLSVLIRSNAVIIISKNNKQDGHLRTLAASLIIHQ
jgi:hypothetical protein